MVLEIAIAPLAFEPKTFNAGDIVRVTVSFKYVAGVDTTVNLLAGPYYTNIFGKHMVDQCVGRADILLSAVSTPTPQTVDVDFVLIPRANGGIENGTYGLRVWVEDTGVMAEQDNIIVVTGNAGSSDMFSSMMPMLMTVMMMGMVMPMMQGVGGGTEE